jgi:hypothetical protein
MVPVANEDDVNVATPLELSVAVPIVTMALEAVTFSKVTVPVGTPGVDDVTFAVRVTGVPCRPPSEALMTRAVSLAAWVIVKTPSVGMKV